MIAIDCPRRPRHGPLRIAAVLACMVSWPGAASAGPAVVAGSRVEAFTAPSRDASVAAELGNGAPICVLDAANYPGVLLHRPGWLAIRLPGGVGYVPVETVDLATPAPELVDCGAPDAQAQAQIPASALAPGARGVAAASAPRRLPVHDSAPAIGRPALIAGGFLPRHPLRFVLGLGSGAAWLSKQAAAAQQIDDSGITVNGTLGFTISDVVMVSGAFAAAFPSDHASFSQQVVPQMGGGDPQTAGSSLAVVSYSLAAGLRTPFLALGTTEHGWVAGAVFAQYGSAGITGSRSISNCVDCRTDELHMPGGAFWQVGFDLVVPSRRQAFSYGVTASYQHYLEGAGFTDELRIGFSCWLL